MTETLYAALGLLVASAAGARAWAWRRWHPRSFWIAIRLDPKQIDALDAIGERKDRSRSRLVRKVVEESNERNAEPRGETPDIE